MVVELPPVGLVEDGKMVRHSDAERARTLDVVENTQAKGNMMEEMHVK